MRGKGLAYADMAAAAFSLASGLVAGDRAIRISPAVRSGLACPHHLWCAATKNEQVILGKSVVFIIFTDYAERNTLSEDDGRLIHQGRFA